MADGVPTPSGVAPSPAGAMPSGGGDSQSTGSSPAAMPVANRGNQAAGLPRLGNAIKLLEIIRITMPAGSDVWRDLGKMIELGAKHVPPGAVSSGLMNTDLERLQQQQRQSSANTTLMRAMGGQGQPQAQPQPPQAA